MPTREEEVDGRLVNVEEIMARVRSLLAAAEGAETGIAPLGLGSPRRRVARTFDEDVYRSLHQAKEISGSLHVDYKVGFRTPIVGQMWAVIRRRIHQEIRIYIDALVRQQVTFNTHVARALGRLVEGVDTMDLKNALAEVKTQKETVDDLRAEIAMLTERLDRLEGRMGPSN